MAANNESLSWKFYLLNIVVVGTLIGLNEAAVGGAIRKAGLPLRGPLVTAIGFALMAVGLAIFKQSRVVPGIAAAAIFSKWLALPLLGLPLFCQANSHFAVLLNGALLFAVIKIFKPHVGAGWQQRGAIAAAAAFSAGTAFFALGRFVAPCRHLLSFKYAGGVAAYMSTRVVPAALLAAVFFPLGYALGSRLEKKILPLWLARKSLLVPLAAAFAVACLGVTVLLTAAGF